MDEEKQCADTGERSKHLISDWQPELIVSGVDRWSIDEVVKDIRDERETEPCNSWEAHADERTNLKVELEFSRDHGKTEDGEDHDCQVKGKCGDVKYKIKCAHQSSIDETRI